MSLKTISNNEMDFILTTFKSPETEYNASSISRQLKISSMGALKIAKKLEKEEILSSKQLGRAKFYKLNLDNEYVRQYVKFLLKKESEQAPAYIKRWINEIKKILTENNSKLVQPGSLTWMFNQPLTLSDTSVHDQVDKLFEALDDQDEVEDVVSNLN